MCRAYKVHPNISSKYYISGCGICLVISRIHGTTLWWYDFSLLVQKLDNLKDFLKHFLVEHQIHPTCFGGKACPFFRANVRKKKTIKKIKIKRRRGRKDFEQMMIKDNHNVVIILTLTARGRFCAPIFYFRWG